MHTWEAFLEEAVPERQMRLHFIGRERKGVPGRGNKLRPGGHRDEGGLGERRCTRGPVVGTRRQVLTEPKPPLRPWALASSCGIVSVSWRRVTGMLTFTTDTGNELVNTHLSGAFPWRMKSFSPFPPLH